EARWLRRRLGQCWHSKGICPDYSAFELGEPTMTGRIVMLTFALSGVFCTAAIAGSPPNPGGGGRAIAATAAEARALDSQAGIPGASSWGHARADIAQGDPAFGGLTNHDLNAGVKAGFGGSPTPGKP